MIKGAVGVDFTIQDRNKRERKGRQLRKRRKRDATRKEDYGTGNRMISCTVRAKRDAPIEDIGMVGYRARGREQAGVRAEKRRMA